MKHRYVDALATGLHRLWGACARLSGGPSAPPMAGPGWRVWARRGFAVACILLLLLPAIPVVRAPQRRGAPPSAAGPTTTERPPVPHGDERFLIVGLTQDLHRTDSIMVAQWDAAHGQARILGVPRDIGVTITGVGFTKLVHAYATGGVGRTRAAVATLLHVPVAHYFVFSLPALRHLVDLVGGVPIDVEKRMLYNDREQGLFIDLQPGPQMLDGVHAEQYLRFRNDPEGDIGRIRRQQHFLRATLVALHRPAVWVRLPQVIAAVRADLGTDLTSEQLLGWSYTVNNLGPDAVSAQSIEGHPNTLFDSVMRMSLSFWVPDITDLRAKVRWLLTGELPPPLPKP